MNQDAEKITALALELIPMAKKWIDAGERGIPLDNLVIEVTGKDPMAVQRELKLSMQSMHATIMLQDLGRELSLRLKAHYPDKGFRYNSVWGSSPMLLISN